MRKPDKFSFLVRLSESNRAEDNQIVTDVEIGSGLILKAISSDHTSKSARESCAVRESSQTTCYIPVEQFMYMLPCSTTVLLIEGLQEGLHSLLSQQKFSTRAL